MALAGTKTRAASTSMAGDAGAFPLLCSGGEHASAIYPSSVIVPAALIAWVHAPTVSHDPALDAHLPDPADRTHPLTSSTMCTTARQLFCDERAGPHAASFWLESLPAIVRGFAPGWECRVTLQLGETPRLE